MTHKPGYLNLLKSGELNKRAAMLEDRLACCDICPRECRVDRTKGKVGVCRSGTFPIVASYCAHHGEEPVLSGSRGSGTIFFGNCNLNCVFCQNHQISQPVKPLKEKEISIEHLADIMLELQSVRCHNINLVSPTHFVPQIVGAVNIAASRGLSIPIVYNSNGYDSADTLRTLDGIIDIYLPDMKYADDDSARECSKAGDYVKNSRTALVEMKRQVGDLILDKSGMALRGLIVRHLVLPNDLSGSKEVLKFIRENLGRNTYVSLMSQYFPSHLAEAFPLLGRPLREREYEKAVEYLEVQELEHGWLQDLSSRENYCPDFERKRPFDQ